MRARERAIALGLAMLAGVACGPAPEAPEPLLAREGRRFAIVVDAPGGSALRTRLTAHPPYHFSLDYPVRVELEGRSATFERTALTREDASDFTESAIEFRVGFEREPGAPASVAATLRFGVCRAEELCEPVSERFELALP